MKNKKSAADFMMLLILAIFMFIILGAIGKNLLGGAGKEASNLQSQTEDLDKDDVANYYDKCPCTKGSLLNDGCPSKKGTEKEKENRRTLVERELKKGEDCEEINKKFKI